MKTKVSEARLAVCQKIREAFYGVSLEDGAGMLEARGLDDYADKATLKKYRREDEKDDWSAIPFEKLQRYTDTLSFFDSKGMRFHLPAFMIGELMNEVSPSPMFNIVHDCAWSQAKFVDLTARQREAVRSYLIVLKEERDYEFEKPEIEVALAKYWTE